MIASKVSFSAHTREMLNARPLSRTHKSRLRQQRIVEYIRELPLGECKKSDLIAAAGWDMSVLNQYANGWQLIESMRKKNVIRMTDGSDPKNSYIKKWEVVADIHVTKPAVEPRKSFEEVTGVPIAPTLPQLEPVIETPITVPDDLLEQAKNFAWNTNSDSLREFLAWLKR